MNIKVFMPPRRSMVVACWVVAGMLAIGILVTCILAATGVFSHKESSPLPRPTGAGPYEPTRSTTPPSGNVGTIENIYILGASDNWIFTGVPGVVDGRSGIGNTGLLATLFDQSKSGEFTDPRFGVLLDAGSHTLSGNLGYYTAVAGLDADKSLVVVNGKLEVPNNQATGALNNFDRSISNLTINVPYYGINYFRVSQASPLRDVDINGSLALSQSTDPPEGGYSSGGYMANVRVSGETLFNSQQQFYSRNCDFGSMPTGGAWNMVFSNIKNVKGNTCPPSKYTPLITVHDVTSCIIEKAPRVVRNQTSGFELLRGVPSIPTVGPLPDSTWRDRSVHFVRVSDPPSAWNEHLQRGTSLVFPPGIYDISEPLRITQPYTCIVGLGYATLRAKSANTIIIISDGAAGARVSALILEAGPINAKGERAPALIEVGERANMGGNLTNPTILSDVFCRVGGPTDTAAADRMIVVRQVGVVIDNTHCWRMDHGAGADQGVGPDKAVCEVAIEVEGDNVTILGGAAEHTLQEQVLWKGNNGTLIFLQTEMPYDVDTNWDYPALRVTGHHFTGVGMAAYSFFANKWGSLKGKASPQPTTGFVVPDTASVHSACTKFLNASAGAGAIKSVLNGKGAATDSLNQGPTWCGLNVTGSSCPSC